MTDYGVAMTDNHAFTCRTCGSTELGRTYLVKEVMFHSGKEFTYDQCRSCASLQIKKIPAAEELAEFYPDEYYSFQAKKASSLKEKLLGLVRTERDRGLAGKSWIGGALAAISSDNFQVTIIGRIGAREEARILDVGCGAGNFLNRLARIGYRNIAGADPFLAHDSTTAVGVPLHKRSLAEMDGVYDIISYHHVFEHVVDPAGELRIISGKLSPGGLCLIQVPTPSSDAWEEYGVNWAHWDAPRHLTLMSRKGFAALAARCGFEVRHIFDIGLPWSLMASELHKRGVKLRTLAELDKQFSKAERASFRRKSDTANRAGRGDAVCYVLARAQPVESRKSEREQAVAAPNY